MPDESSGTEQTTGQSGPSEPTEKEFDLSGGRLCLDFANTESERQLPTTRDELETYDDLVAFVHQSGALDDDAAAALRRAALERPGESAEALERARRLRGGIFRVLASRAVDGNVGDPDLASLGDDLARVLARSRLVTRDGGFAWDWSGAADALERPLWPIARSTADLLTSSDLETVKECASPTCTWLFVDTSRNRSRRWCDMKVCGNRAKARRHYERHKAD
jgi:predicted RNA-binding Zn ribbon-like protein